MKRKKKIHKGGAPPPLCQHRQGGEVKPVSIGNFTICAGGGMYLTQVIANGFDYCVDLRAERLPKETVFGESHGGWFYLPIEDYSVVRESDWPTWFAKLTEILDLLKDGKRVLVFCAGGHGRTGLFLASLLAMVEPHLVDPVAEVRHRYCPRAVETPEQAAQVMRLQDETRAALAL